MQNLSVPERPSICLVARDRVVHDEIVQNASPACDAEFFGISNLVDLRGEPTPTMERLETAARQCDAVIVDWDLEQALIIGILAYHMRYYAAPLVALVGDDPDESIAALLVGVDSILRRPLSVPLLRAQVIAHLRALQSAPLSGLGRDPDNVVSHQKASEPDFKSNKIAIGELALEPREFRFFVKGTSVRLTPRQYALMLYLLEHSGGRATASVA